MNPNNYAQGSRIQVKADSKKKSFAGKKGVVKYICEAYAEVQLDDVPRMYVQVKRDEIEVVLD